MNYMALLDFSTEANKLGHIGMPCHLVVVPNRLLSFHSVCLFQGVANVSNPNLSSTAGFDI